MAGEVGFVSLAVIAVLAACAAIFVSFLIVFTFRHSHLFLGAAGLQPGDIKGPPEPIHGEVEGKASGGGGGGREMIGYCGWQSPEGKYPSTCEACETAVIAGEGLQKHDGSRAGGDRWAWTAAFFWWAAGEDYVISA